MHSFDPSSTHQDLASGVDIIIPIIVEDTQQALEQEAPLEIHGVGKMPPSSGGSKDHRDPSGPAAAGPLLPSQAGTPG